MAFQTQKLHQSQGSSALDIHAFSAHQGVIPGVGGGKTIQNIKSMLWILVILRVRKRVTDNSLTNEF